MQRAARAVPGRRSRPPPVAESPLLERSRHDPRPLRHLRHRIAAEDACGSRTATSSPRSTARSTCINLRPNETLLNIGPYTHIATLVEFLVSKSRGFTVAYFTREPDDDDVLEDEIAKLHRQGVRIKALLGVPKFWTYLVKEVLEEMKNKPSLTTLYESLLAIERNGTLQDIGTIDKAKLTAARILLRNKLGGHFAYGISSSTKMDGALVRILGKLGITCIDIYGATECTGIIARNRSTTSSPAAAAS